MNKKKLLIIFLVVTLSGCGAKEDNTITEASTEISPETTTEVITEAITEATPEDALLDFEEEHSEDDIKKKGKSEDAILTFDDKICLYNDEKFTVNLKGLFQERNNTDGEIIVDKGILLDVTNNTNNKCMFNLEDLYLGDEGAICIIKSGNEGPSPGKTREYSFYINRDTQTSEKILDKLNELSDLNGEFSFEIYSDDESYIDLDKSYNVSFSLIEHKDEINNIVDENIDYEYTGFSFTDEKEGQADLTNFDILGKWYSLRGNVKEEYAFFNEDGTISYGDKTKCTWELKPEKKCVYLYFPDYDWGGDYAINEYNGYYIIQLEDITFVRPENYDDYIESVE